MNWVTAPTWKFNRATGVHPTGLKVRFIQQQAGTRGKEWAFQDESLVRWIVRVEAMPEGMSKADARELIKGVGYEWVKWRREAGRPRPY